MVLYRKYRPQKFADLTGQKLIAETLLASLASGKISHGYLFAGPRGIGKTSTARIFAKAVNCKSYQKQKFGEPCNRCTSCLSVADGSHLDLVEIDAASNRGIDEIRDLREKIKLSPVSARFKIYIIDEAHMLTPEAFNALLKTLEEPPQHVIFILCTTAASKIPATILSRLTRFNFKRAAEDEIIGALKKIANAEKIKIEDDALFEIAKLSDGSYRDAISILDQLAAAGSKISLGKVRGLAHVSAGSLIYDFIMAFSVGDLKKAVLLVEEAAARQTDFSAFCLAVVRLLES
jgi:DNA polymerase-3 subunit gamma/tau